MPERWAFLHQVVVQKPKVAVLREDGDFVVDRAILEVKYQATGYLIASGDLAEVAVGDSVTFPASAALENRGPNLPCSEQLRAPVSLAVRLAKRRLARRRLSERRVTPTKDVLPSRFPFDLRDRSTYLSPK
jgi:hypothetical protein